LKRTVLLCIAVASLVAVAGPSNADLCEIDDTPAATLLLPYFEVDLTDENGDGLVDLTNRTTLFSINNASATAILAHVVLWTDWTVPTLDFDIYLTGFDVVTINLAHLFNGFLPVTASDGQDPQDTISPQGPFSQDINFASCTGRFPFNAPELSSQQLTHLRRSHTGLSSPIFGNRCAGAAYGDNVARGYLTVDTVNSCSLLFPGQPGYFAPGGTGIATNQNVLWGNYHYVDGPENFAQGETLVHIEASATLDETTVDDTFYSRFTVIGEDNREPLPTTFAARYITAGAFDGGTDLIVWREGGIPDFDGFICGTEPLWFPLNQTQVVAFDEEENATGICIPGEDRVSPPTGEAQTCFPLETQRVPVGRPTPVPGGDDVAPVDPIGGWLFLNLNYDLGAGAGGVGTSAPPDPKQAWVTTAFSALGRFSTGMDAIQLDSACTTTSPGPTIFGP